MWQDAQKFLLKDKYIAPLIKTWGDCTITPIKKSLYFEDLVDAICSQQLSGKAAKTIFGRVKNFLGEITPENVADADPLKLRGCGLSNAKVSYIKDLAEKVRSKAVLIDSLNKFPDDEVIEALVMVKGIGRWTAEMFLMFSLGRPDIFPIDDLGIKKGFEKVVGKRLEGKKLSDFAETRWKPYRTVASWYLWRSLENR